MVNERTEQTEGAHPRFRPHGGTRTFFRMAAFVFGAVLGIMQPPEPCAAAEPFVFGEWQTLHEQRERLEVVKTIKRLEAEILELEVRAKAAENKAKSVQEEHMDDNMKGKAAGERADKAVPAETKTAEGPVQEGAEQGPQGKKNGRGTERRQLLCVERQKSGTTRSHPLHPTVSAIERGVDGIYRAQLSLPDGRLVWCRAGETVAGVTIVSVRREGVFGVMKGKRVGLLFE